MTLTNDDDDVIKRDFRFQCPDCDELIISGKRMSGDKTKLPKPETSRAMCVECGALMAFVGDWQPRSLTTEERLCVPFSTYAKSLVIRMSRLAAIEERGPCPRCLHCDAEVPARGLKTPSFCPDCTRMMLAIHTAKYETPITSS
jgi:Zn finger protein HypA/HybF involved in hydrogenase expression